MFYYQFYVCFYDIKIVAKLRYLLKFDFHVKSAINFELNFKTSLKLDCFKKLRFRDVSIIAVGLTSLNQAGHYVLSFRTRLKFFAFIKMN